MKLNLGIFTHAPPERLSPSSCHQTPSRNKLLSPSQVAFFLKISPPGTKWVEGERVKTMVLNKSQLVCCLATHRKSIHTLFHSWDIRPSGPIWSNLLRVSWVIVSISGPRILPVMEFGMRSELSQWFSFQAFFSTKKKKIHRAHF